MNAWPAFSPREACCLSGHRDLPAAALPALALKLAGALDELCARGVTVFLCGGARGFDLLAAEAVLALKARAPGAKLLMALPCPEQTRGWPAADARRHAEILRRCDGAV
ncbi:MAG: DUF1273 family protein, partial [Clostridia bacterium]|nr:DUF1273 family protein [Clostridia bacterium]